MCTVGMFYLSIKLVMSSRFRRSEKGRELYTRVSMEMGREGDICIRLVAVYKPRYIWYFPAVALLAVTPHHDITCRRRRWVPRVTEVQLLFLPTPSFMAAAVEGRRTRVTPLWFLR